MRMNRFAGNIDETMKKRCVSVKNAAILSDYM